MRSLTASEPDPVTFPGYDRAEDVHDDEAVALPTNGMTGRPVHSLGRTAAVRYDNKLSCLLTEQPREQRCRACLSASAKDVRRSDCQDQ